MGQATMSAEEANAAAQVLGLGPEVRVGGHMVLPLPFYRLLFGWGPLATLRRIRAGVIPAEQYCKGAPWVIKRRDIEDPRLAERVKVRRIGPPSASPDQQTLPFQ